MTSRISRTLLIASVMACVFACPAWGLPSLGSVSGTAGNGSSGGGASEVSRSASSDSDGAKSVVRDAADTAGSAARDLTDGGAAREASGATDAIRDAGGRDSTDAIRDAAGGATGAARDAVGGTTSAVRDTAGRDSTDAIRDAAGATKDLTRGDSAAGVVESIRETVDGAANEIAESSGGRGGDPSLPVDVGGVVSDPMNAAGGESAAGLNRLGESRAQEAAAAPFLADTGAPSSGAGILPTQMGTTDDSAAGGQDAPAAWSAPSRADSPDPSPAPRSVSSRGTLTGADSPSARRADADALPLTTPPDANSLELAGAAGSPAADVTSDAPTGASGGGTAFTPNASATAWLTAVSTIAGLATTNPRGVVASTPVAKQDAPGAPPAGASGIAAGISAAASSTLLLVLASVLALWLAGPASRLRPRIAARTTGALRLAARTAWLAPRRV